MYNVCLRPCVSNLLLSKLSLSTEPTRPNFCCRTFQCDQICFVAGVSRLLSVCALLWDVNVQDIKMAVGLEEQVMLALARALIGAIRPPHLLDRRRGMSTVCLSTDFISRCRLLLIVHGLSSCTVFRILVWFSVYSVWTVTIYLFVSTVMSVLLFRSC